MNTNKSKVKEKQQTKGVKGREEDKVAISSCSDLYNAKEEKKKLSHVTRYREKLDNCSTPPSPFFLLSSVTPTTPTP